MRGQLFRPSAQTGGAQVGAHQQRWYPFLWLSHIVLPKSPCPSRQLAPYLRLVRRQLDMEALGQAIANLFGIDVDPRLVMERLDIATLQAARPYAVQAVVAGTATVALWRILQWYFRRPFRTLPAPPPQNFFVGELNVMVS